MAELRHGASETYRTEYEMRVLILSHWFPPANVIGAVRPHALARYLCDQGHEVTVVCAGTTGFAQSMNADVSGIRIERVQVTRLVLALEPTRGQGALRRLTNGLVRQVLFPDTFALLRQRYRSAAVAAFQSGPAPDVIVSCALPFSLHVTARSLARFWGRPWIADNRDLWANSPYRRRPAGLRSIDRRYERHVLRDASRVVAIGTHMAAEISAATGEPEKVAVIRNGADMSGTDVPAERTSGQRGGELRIAYCGILYGGRRDPRPLLAALTKLKQPAIVEFIGTEPQAVAELEREFPALRIVRREWLPKQLVKQIQRDADLLLVALGPGAFEKGVLTGKFFEYVESRRPIIAVCDEDSELASLVMAHDLGIATRSVDRIAAYIEGQITAGLPDLPPVPLELRRDRQMADFMALLAEVVG